MDVKYQLVLPLHLWSSVCLRLPPRQREWYEAHNPFTCRTLLTISTAAQVAQQMQAQQTANPMMGAPGQDPDKQFKAEAENLAVIEHYSVLDDVEERLLAGIKA